MKNQFIFLHDADNEEYPVWINFSLVLRIDEYKSGSRLQLVGKDQYFYAVEPPEYIMRIVKG